ncbi:TadE/TadG family type IV pilus assembly protein [Alteraurantiacibacter aquimixticola]|uniref:Pilus assembly protein n=1 Tax=Alteraurantiacibacter aquimixticola TaxID=2489173 RepID=A0A4T3EZ87_9SPHN|nr:hypothetical protein [Alteraurantiacibacter aquimixticola]TIX50062.1 hypothetical protein E5222_07115 [Alteraurantiacibacter aquimixticola]
MTNMIDSKRTAPLQSLFSRLMSDTSGVALTEFAYVAPMFMTLGILGLDTANFVVTHMRISQVALQVADNASRVGELDVLQERKVTEADINDVFVGAERYASGLKIGQNGRIILSSLEVLPPAPGEEREEGVEPQYIHWQRCYGQKDYYSSYGSQGDGLEQEDNFQGMGDDTALIKATKSEAVMFVEVAFDYESISPFSVFDGQQIIYTGSFNVRDARDLTRLYPTAGLATATCPTPTPTPTP